MEGQFGTELSASSITAFPRMVGLVTGPSVRRRQAQAQLQHLGPLAAVQLRRGNELPLQGMKRFLSLRGETCAGLFEFAVPYDSGIT